jgi:hypothetical protein
MSLTLAEARDAVVEIVTTAWDAAPPSDSIAMHYDDVKADKPGGTTEALPFARTTVRILSSPQSTQGRRRYLTSGAVTVQIFTPFGDGHTLGDELSQIVLVALRGHVGSTGGLWFFDAVQNEIGEDGPWFQTNVDATFRFQEDAP